MSSNPVQAGSCPPLNEGRGGCGGLRAADSEADTGGAMLLAGCNILRLLGVSHDPLSVSPSLTPFHSPCVNTPLYI